MAGVSSMLDKKDILKEIKSKIVEAGEIKNSKSFVLNEDNSINQKEVVLFFSYDVVNSTLYKTIDSFTWAQVLNLLFSEIQNEVQLRIPSAEMWRVLGDEAIFIVKICDDKILAEHIYNIFEILIFTISKLKAKKFFNNYDDLRIQNPEDYISLKASAWIASVIDIGYSGETSYKLSEYDNIFERYESAGHYQFFEFLGNDIDTGFRVSKFTEEGRLALSFELACLLLKETESLTYLNIITYRNLKGIWNNGLYPVIWYHNPSAYLDEYKQRIELKDSFKFDAIYESQLVKEYFQNISHSEGGLFPDNPKMIDDVYYALNKILRDKNLQKKIDEIENIIKESRSNSKRFMNIDFMQLHCVAVCYMIDEKQRAKILVAHRNDNRELFKDNWEFGCAKATINKSISDKIKEEYKEDFDIDIDPVVDNLRSQKEPIPIAIYSVEHKANFDMQGNDKGIITLARIKGNFDIAKFVATDKHDKLAWIYEEDNLEDFTPSIPDFAQTLKTCFARIKEIEDEKS